MFMLTAGLLLFLGTHSVRVVADPWRTRMIRRISEGPWKGLYSLVSAAGFGLVLWGFSLAGRNPVFLYTAPVSMRRLTAVVWPLGTFCCATASRVRRRSSAPTGSCVGSAASGAS